MKPIRFVGNSLKAVNSFAEEVREEIFVELRALSHGLGPADWKPMSSIGMGVNEIRIHGRTEHRVIYVAKFKDAIYVLHAFEKKTQKTSNKDIELAKTRYRHLVNELKK